MTAPRYGLEDNKAKKIILDFWLTISRGDTRYYDPRPGVRVTAGYPKLARNERAINMKISLPFALFETPSITATIDVETPAEVVNIDTPAIAEAVRQAIGMDVDIRVSRNVIPLKG